MICNSLNILLIFSILGCPVWCSLERCLTVEENCFLNADVSTCCCPRYSPSSCRNEQQSSEPSVPHEEKPRSNCQGICGGAVFEHRGVDTTAELSLTSQHVGVSTTLLVDRLAGQQLYWQPPSDGSSSPGRLLCLLHMSLQI